MTQPCEVRPPYPSRRNKEKVGLGKCWVENGDLVFRRPNSLFKKLSNCHESDITWLTHVVQMGPYSYEIAMGSVSEHIEQSMPRPLNSW